MRKLRALEDVLIRVESALAVVLVLTMLLLAAYNVVYRNVLVPLQQHWAHSGPPVQPAAPGAVAAEGQGEASPAEAKTEGEGEAKAEPAEAAREGGDDFGGFGGLGEEDPGAVEAEAGKAAGSKSAADDFGGFGDEDEGAPEAKAAPEAKVEPAKPAKPASDDFGGFGGGLDEETEPEPATPPPAKAPEKVAVAEPAQPAKTASDDFGGFGGGLGDDEPEDAPEPGEAKAEPTKAAADDFGGFGGLDDGGDAKAEGEPKAGAGEAPAAPAAEDELDEDDDFGEDDLGDDDQFANLPDIDAASKQSVDAIPQGGPPPEGSFAAWAVAFIDDIKLDWIDLFLRQLVIIVAFFGAMLATQRGKHINVDALSKLLPRGVQRIVGVILPLAAVSVCLVLAKAGWDLVQIGREYPKDLLPSVPEWTLQLMFPVGFGLLALHFVVRMVEAAVAPPDPDPKLRSATTAAVVAADDVDGDPTDDVDVVDDDDLADRRGDVPQKGGR